jgi:hypothetical protein
LARSRHLADRMTIFASPRSGEFALPNAAEIQDRYYAVSISSLDLPPANVGRSYGLGRKLTDLFFTSGYQLKSGQRAH